ncbi:MAG: DMT family transporter [Firmicutes bacterium]|nr:DMT family transporter [Bacillota bacterium]
MNNRILTNTFVIALGALLCCALWGSATPFIKIGYQLMLPQSGVPSTMLFAGIRFTLAGIITVLIYSIGRKQFLRPKKQNWGKVMQIGLFQTIIQYIFFYVGLANTSGVKGTIISGSSAFFCLLVASLIFRQEKLTLKKIFGCVLGFAGIIIVNLNGLDFNMNFFGDAFVLFSTIAYSISSVLMKRYSKDEDPVVISGYQFIFGGIVMIVIGLCLGGTVVITSVKAAGVLIYLSFLSAVAYSVWGVLLKFNPVSRVTIYSFMTPVFGVILSSLMLSEQSNVAPLNLIITLVLVCAGIIVLNYKKEPESPARPR